MKIQNSDPNKTFSSIKHKDDIVKRALNTFPIYWTQTCLTTSDSTTPLFLACVSRHINLQQLKKDIISHMDISFPFDLTRKPQVAIGKIDNKSDPIKISASVIKVSCAKADAAELQQKFFSSFGSGVAYSPLLLLSSLPYVKVMVT